jgi:hypothetical protein
MVDESNPTRAALDLGYVLSDDFYADRTSLKWRGRELFAPDLAIGRLVETPGEIETMIQAFLDEDPLSASTAFVSGYDFLVDSAEAISDTLDSGGLTLTTLINDTWDATQLQNNWLNTPKDLASVNAHFDHWQAIPATGAVTLDTGDVAATTNMSGTVNFSMGCHSGFSVHDAHASSGYPLDFAQALAQKGVWWIGNTGYGYGMDDSIAFTEQLMHFFAQRLVSDVTVGEALRWAKNRYLGGAPSGGFGTYDEKVMIEATLYGLPMYHVSVPSGPAAPETPPVSANDLTTETVSFDLSSLFQLETGSEYGDYYSISGEVQASPGRPVQPRTSELVPVKTGLTPHGAVLVSATSEQTDGFDPLISRPVSDTTLSEPLFEAESWFPAKTWAVNRLGDEARLVVVPAQFQGNQDGGAERRFTQLTFSVTYSDSVDFTPPAIWKVESVLIEETTTFTVSVQDSSGIERVLVTYSADGQSWQSADLTYDTSTGQVEQWGTSLTSLTEETNYFIQVVDAAGNVTVSDNKGQYFAPEPPAAPPGGGVYLPIILRNFP